MLLYPFPTQSRPAPPHPTGIAERASFHTDLEKPRSRLHLHLPDKTGQCRESEAMPEKVKRHLALKNTPVNAGQAKRYPPPQRARLRPVHLPRRASEAMLVSDKGPPPCRPLPQAAPKRRAPRFPPERFRSNSASPNCEDQRRGNRGARWEQNGLLTRGAAAACAARYRRVGAAGAQSGRGIRDEDGPPPPRVREPRAYQDDRAKSCPSRPPR